MNGRLKKNLGLWALPIACLFLFNPDIAVVDVLPDVFGYTAALPQIMKLADIDYFMTTKISWSEYNRFPFDTFLWKGIE